MSDKIRRNDLCSCGSGKKFKKCCFGRQASKYDLFKGKSFFELSAVALILFVFFTLGAHAIASGHYEGQDFLRHSTIMKISADAPLKALTAPITMTGGTPSTLFHFIGGRIYSIFGEGLAWKVLSFINIFLNIITLLLFYLFLCRVVTSGLLRVACMFFISFLPVMVITSMVIAADAFMPFLFMVSVWILILISDRLKKGTPVTGLMALQGGLVIVASLIKINFIFIFAGMAFIGIILYRSGILGPRQLLSAFFLMVLVPVAIITILWFSYISKQTPVYQAHQARNFAELSSTHMDFRSLLFFKKKDIYLLDAPYFHEMRFQDGRHFHPMWENNYYSYPALLHLGIFTDLLNIDQPIRFRDEDPGMTDNYYTRVRPQENQERMKVSVRTSLVFSAAVFWAMLWSIGVCFNAFGQGKENKDIPVIILFATGFFLFVAMMLSLPFMILTYPLGFWLPRLVMPSLLAFGTVLFVALDRMPFMEIKALRVAILAMAVGQSLLQISFLWSS